ncbi:metallo-beta-lactamase family protein [Dethiosulfatibacter aminovorans DSM 17477]|uniref:Metallo-beta-lactamase family protein n=1 Tax=Dethiosulfatibacter aminovorans DSM 17477 TaxID=1121476 RepID=A0A1M6KC46_9FIRM|nr:MBL fold metallo-hydrolase [Dethiosulfatibacter aminovorans]SHJ56511.1 metallo-beta-lactamase family protein [Dethiosulfatibacter aminovorans DSM 17477]
MKIKFTGAAGTVTGSCHYIEYGSKKLLLDCGQFQGKKNVEKLNEEGFPFDPAEIDYLILSHAHIDHSGRIPLLVKDGFKGKIFSSSPTYDLCTIMLMDSAHIHEMEAEWKSQKSMRKGGEPVAPLYTTEDAQASLNYFNPVLYEQYEEIDDILTIRFVDAGHILGSSIVELWFKENGESTKVVFSGDLGMKDKPIIRDPQIVEKADYLIIESTYGNRLHESPEQRVDKLSRIIIDTVKNKGTVVIPSFAVGRTQEIIYSLNEHYDGNDEFSKYFKDIPVYIDSPLASKATEIFKKNAYVFDEEAREKILSGDNPLEFKNLHFTHTTDESKALNMSSEPKVIISASGMCNAGRVRHHLKHNLWKKNSSIVFVGYQAEGTLGRLLKNGEKEVRLFGEDICVQARIESVEGFSGHADQEGLLEWLKGFKEAPKKVFVVHGEPDARDEFSRKIEEELGFSTVVPKMNSEYLMENGEVSVIEEGYVLDLAMEEVGEAEKAESKKTVREDKAEIEKHEAKIDKVDKKDVKQTLKPEEERKVGKIEETAEKEDDEPCEEEKVKRLKEDIARLKELAGKAFDMTETTLDNDEIKVGEYKIINNLILELEKSLVNLTMQSGD